MPELKIIAHIENDFNEKFGIPRQSGLADIESRIIFEPPYRSCDAFRGLEGFSHLWLIWQFSEAMRGDWSPTVRPPRLGGNKRMGVFATRSPFRPNSIGLSSVKLNRIELQSPNGPVLYVSGADILSGTPIFDVKPYLAYTDSHPDASGGFSLSSKEEILKVDFPENLLQQIPPQKRKGLVQILAQDPRPQYQSSAERIYTMSFGGYDISFFVDNNILNVTEIRRLYP
ncbi:MAG: tRNA (N6-threonylcarbamoyladenosine(37)-N6)-methyltransferase TrmO [Oscillospiraceae bacterium]|nr:tRNA (N6-threonylcarbamoyladenosine(37)-N6)-methyltransferase TrmO [Oscillospiraceae bacterium]